MWNKESSFCLYYAKQQQLWVYDKDKKSCRTKRKNVKKKVCSRFKERVWEIQKWSEQLVEWVVSHPAPLQATSNWTRLNISSHLLTVNYIKAPTEKLWWCRWVFMCLWYTDSSCCLLSNQVQLLRCLSIFYCLLIPSPTPPFLSMAMNLNLLWTFT